MDMLSRNGFIQENGSIIFVVTLTLDDPVGFNYREKMDIKASHPSTANGHLHNFLFPSPENAVQVRFMAQEDKIPFRIFKNALMEVNVNIIIFISMS